MAHVVSINVSARTGTAKTPVPSCIIGACGIEGDAHAGSWHRQVSLLAQESVDRLAREEGCEFNPGEFAENLTISGLDLSAVHLRDRLAVGSAELEVTQKGKPCHGAGCAVFQAVGRCVMPKEGVFARVVKGGEVKTGDPVSHTEVPLQVRIFTLSDRASRGEYEDRSGPTVERCIETIFASLPWSVSCGIEILPDDGAVLRSRLEAAARAGADIILTTGGTGIGPRDITPDVIRPMLDKEIPGVMEAIRVKFGAALPAALLSRSVAGVMGKTLVYALPGGVKAVEEYLGEIGRTLEHALFMLAGYDVH